MRAVFEADFYASPFDGFLLNGGIAYVESEIREFPNGPCFTPAAADPGCDLATQTKDLAGEELPNSPDLKFNVSADYEMAVGETLKLGARTTVTYQDEVNFSLAQDPATVQESYALVGRQHPGWRHRRPLGTDRLRAQPVRPKFSHVAVPGLHVVHALTNHSAHSHRSRAPLRRFGQGELLIEPCQREVEDRRHHFALADKIEPCEIPDDTDGTVDSRP